MEMGIFSSSFDVVYTTTQMQRKKLQYFIDNSKCFLANTFLNENIKKISFGRCGSMGKVRKNREKENP